MVAVVTGGGLGLNLGSGSVLGGAGVGGAASFGRQSDSVYVNAASGNLVVQARDELLVGRGLDVAGLRTYNSLGAFVDDNGDNWQAGLVRKVWLNSGTANTLGSVVYRREEDDSSFITSITGASLAGRRGWWLGVDRDMPMSPQARRRLRPRSQARATWARRASGLTIFCVDLLQDFDVQITLGQQLLEPAVLQLQRLQALDVSDFLLAEVLAPGVDRGLADLVLLGRLGHPMRDASV